MIVINAICFVLGLCVLILIIARAIVSIKLEKDASTEDFKYIKWYFVDFILKGMEIAFAVLYVLTYLIRIIILISI